VIVTTASITDDQLNSLRAAAAEADDITTVVICDLAINGAVDLEDYSARHDWDTDRKAIWAKVSVMTRLDALKECVEQINYSHGEAE
jgi:hypothetical protein